MIDQANKAPAVEKMANPFKTISQLYSESKDLSRAEHFPWMHANIDALEFHGIEDSDELKAAALKIEAGENKARAYLAELKAGGATELDRLTNPNGQEIAFLEHHQEGQGACIIAACGEFAQDTDFFDLGDLMGGGDYTPYFIGHELFMQWEM